MRKVGIMSLLVLTFILTFGSTASAGIFSPKNPIKSAKTGWIENVHVINSSQPVLLGKWSGRGYEYQEFGYLKKKYDSYYHDQWYSSEMPISKKYRLPYEIKLKTGSAKEVTTSLTVSGGVGLTSKLIESNLGLDSSISVTNSDYWEVERPLIADSYGLWRVGGYFRYETLEYEAYTLSWNYVTNKFKKYKSGYKVYVHVPKGYIITEIKQNPIISRNIFLKHTYLEILHSIFSDAGFIFWHEIKISNTFLEGKFIT